MRKCPDVGVVGLCIGVSISSSGSEMIDVTISEELTEGFFDGKGLGRGTGSPRLSSSEGSSDSEDDKLKRDGGKLAKGWAAEDSRGIAFDIDGLLPELGGARVKGKGDPFLLWPIGFKSTWPVNGSSQVTDVFVAAVRQPKRPVPFAFSSWQRRSPMSGSRRLSPLFTEEEQDESLGIGGSGPRGELPALNRRVTTCTLPFAKGSESDVSRADECREDFEEGWVWLWKDELVSQDDEEEWFISVVGAGKKTLSLEDMIQVRIRKRADKWEIEEDLNRAERRWMRCYRIFHDDLLMEGKALDEKKGRSLLLKARTNWTLANQDLAIETRGLLVEDLEDGGEGGKEVKVDSFESKEVSISNAEETSSVNSLRENATDMVKAMVVVEEKKKKYIRDDCARHKTTQIQNVHVIRSEARGYLSKLRRTEGRSIPYTPLKAPPQHALKIYDTWLEKQRLVRPLPHKPQNDDFHLNDDSRQSSVQSPVLSLRLILFNFQLDVLRILSSRIFKLTQHVTVKRRSLWGRFYLDLEEFRLGNDLNYTFFSSFQASCLGTYESAIIPAKAVIHNHTLAESSPLQYR
ncbi:hypothetical protein FB446DRAFT_776076 [Lentinula raphanica]|nr:hypothetical protein FB446DRAFT_776076 [Lentinula raphanica]